MAGRIRPWVALSGATLSGLAANLTVTNSRWTARRIHDAYGWDAEVLYPPAQWSSEPVPWDDRDDAFACVGRISGEKRILQIIDLMERVRRRGHDVRLEIIGNDLYPDYTRQVRERASQAGGWVALGFDLDRASMERKLSRCRYGIHAMVDEHFGIAVAEMVRAGCVVFARVGGGPEEILGAHDELMFDSDDQAVDRICAMLDAPERQKRALQHLADRRGMFGPEQFMNALKARVRRFARTRE
jgi:glycosyltransferase involved in cell wall biosynthesis